ncbi:hypothetical protein Tco_0927101 [Tanacetum coccineum]|uniref:Uncharacterized protein n=1 Tax=Tanacetum coccineum TaxID=301880 RepID=A0ABQ5DCT8_9ASTR
MLPSMNFTEGWTVVSIQVQASHSTNDFLCQQVRNIETYAFQYGRSSSALVPITRLVPISSVHVPCCPAPRMPMVTFHDSYLRKVVLMLLKTYNLIKYLLPDTSVSDVETLFGSVDSHVFDHRINVMKPIQSNLIQNFVNIEIRGDQDLHCIKHASMKHGHLSRWKCKNRLLNERTEICCLCSQPEGFVDPEHPSMLYRLKKAPFIDLNKLSCVLVIQKARKVLPSPLTEAEYIALSVSSLLRLQAHDITSPLYQEQVERKSMLCCFRGRQITNWLTLYEGLSRESASLLYSHCLELKNVSSESERIRMESVSSNHVFTHSCNIHTVIIDPHGIRGANFVEADLRRREKLSYECIDDL